MNSALSDPYSFSQNPGNVTAFQNQTNATYTGPQSYADDAAAYQTAQGATQKAEDTTQAAQSEGGRFALLNNYFGTPDYSQGQKSLDNLLLQGDSTTQQGINQARANADQAQINFQNQAPQLQNYAAQNIATTQGTAQNVQNQANANIAQMQTDYQNALTNAQTQNASQAAQVAQANTANPSDYLNLYGQFGLTGPLNEDLTQNQMIRGPVPETVLATPNYNLPSGGSFQAPNYSVDASGDTGYWGITPAQYLSQGLTPNASSVLTLDQQQKLNALQGLMGQSQTPFDATQAGAYNPNSAYTFDETGFANALAQAKAAYNAQANPMLQNIGQEDYGYQNGNPNSISVQTMMNQVNALNALRANYGLAAVTNPFKV